MIRTLAAIALLGLAACQQGGVWANVPRDDSPDGQACRREAAEDPEVRRIASTATSGNLAQDERVREELLVALPRAWRACMTRRGALPPGGVEQVRRVTF
jgi:predicted DCC family thiol-disulfide oxidoreductase YuxK